MDNVKDIVKQAIQEKADERGEEMDKAIANFLMWAIPIFLICLVYQILNR